jgi:hypothetical protein
MWTPERCDECGKPLTVVYGSRFGGIRLYECPLGHVLLIGAQGQVIK